MIFVFQIISPVFLTFPFLFGPLKQHLEGRRFHSNEELEMVLVKVCGCKSDFYRDRVFKAVPGWDKCINVLGDCVEK
jgi:hypothetical protein